MISLHSLQAFGQSAWLNYLRRAFLESGELGNLLEEGIGGITSTPSIFAKAISHSSDYDEVLLRLVAQGKPIADFHKLIIIDDMQRAADALHPVHEATDGLDGYVSVELDPAVIDDAVKTAATARHLLRAVDRGNAMIEIPATPAGIAAVRELTSDGVCVNVTHVFSVAMYEQVANAYLAGLAQFFETHTVWRIAPSSVVSFSLSRIDRAVDDALAELHQDHLQGQAAIALAKTAYGRFQQIFSGPEWEKLARRGARPLRLKWTRTTPRNFTYPDTYYVEALIGPETVMTFSPPTLRAFQQSGVVAPTLTQRPDQAKRVLANLADLGIDLDAIAARLQEESLADFRQQYEDLQLSVRRKRDQLQANWRRMELALGGLKTAVSRHTAALCRGRVPCRLWDHDHTLWPASAVDQLGWLHIVETMQENLGRLRHFNNQVLQDGITDMVYLGMAGENILTGIFAGFPHRSGGLNLHPLANSDPHTIRQLTKVLNPAKTLFVVGSKDGKNLETMALFKHFYNITADALDRDHAGTRVGQHFVAITDNNSALHRLAGEYGFRQIFLNDSHIPEGFTALSYFGLVPAVLLGVDGAALLENALALVGNSSSCNCPEKGDNLGMQLGVVLATLAEQGRDKLVLSASPALAPFTRWIAQMIAVCLAKEQKGLVPVVAEPVLETTVYGHDRAFVYLHLANDPLPDYLRKLEAAGHPLIILHWEALNDLGGQLFLWQIAAVVAAHLMQINPFTTPNVELVNRRAQELLAFFQQQGRLPPGKAAPVTPQSLEAFLDQVQPGDYIITQAFISPSPESEAVLQEFCACLRRKKGVPVMLNYGPAYLSTLGQLYQGGPRTGYFVQLTMPLPLEDVHIPDVAGEPATSLSFGVLNMANALADGQVLARNWRHMMRFHLPNGVQDLRPLLDDMR